MSCIPQEALNPDPPPDGVNDLHHHSAHMVNWIRTRLKSGGGWLAVNHGTDLIVMCRVMGRKITVLSVEGDIFEAAQTAILYLLREADMPPSKDDVIIYSKQICITPERVLKKIDELPFNELAQGAIIFV